MFGITAEDPAGWIAVMLVALAAVWKIYLRVRDDHRIDGLRSLNKQSEERITGTYTQLIEQMRAEVNRLAEAVAHMSTELDTEREARRAAEAKSGELAARVYHLERILIKHGIVF